MKTTLLSLLSLIVHVSGIPIDNGVEGEPEIECGSRDISINFNTQNTFEGKVYVKGRYFEPECRAEDRSGRRNAGITLGFSSCGLQRTRSVNPRGIFVTTTVIITFHPQFLTKVDKAYTIQCFYMEADKTVDTNLEVSALPTVPELATQTVPMPVCRYEILDGGASGPVIQYAIVGQEVYHKWTCISETEDTFCMYVYGCFVDDKNGDRVTIIDDDGCAVDRNLLLNLDYPTDLMAGQKTHVFKYADRASLYFNCQIAISVKEPEGICPRPECQAPGGTTGRKKRDVMPTAIIDVSTHDLEVLDISDEPTNQLQSLLHQQLDSVRDDVCFSTSGFAVLLSIALITFVAMIASITVHCATNSKY